MDEPIVQMNLKVPERYRDGIRDAAKKSGMSISEWMTTMLDDVLGWVEVENEKDHGNERTEATGSVQGVAEEV